MQKSFIQAEFSNQVTRDTKYNTTGRRVVNEIQGQNQNQKAEKTKARQKLESKNKGSVQKSEAANHHIRHDRFMCQN